MDGRRGGRASGAAWPTGLPALIVAVMLALVAPAGSVGAPAVAGADRQATPVGDDEPGGGALRELLALAPDVLRGAEWPVQIATYADVAAQLSAVGVPAPASPDADGLGRYLGATLHLVLPSDLASHAADPRWRESFGFDAFQVDRALTVGEPPSVTTILQGRFDPAEVRAALERTGYRPVAVDLPGVTAASLAEEPGFDRSSPIVHLALNSMNNAALLPDGTLVFASALTRLQATLDVLAGNLPSLAARPEVRSLLAAAPRDLAAAVLVSGEALRGEPGLGVLVGATPDLSGAATAIAARMAELARMPPVRLALFGITVGGPVSPGLVEATPAPAPPGQPVARFAIALLMPNAAAATAAVPVIEERLATGRSLATDRAFDEFFPAAERRVAALPGEAVVRLDLGLSDEAPLRVWIDLLFRRDVGFVAW